MAIFDSMAAARRRRLFLLGLIPTGAASSRPVGGADQPSVVSAATSDSSARPPSAGAATVPPASIPTPAPERRPFRRLGAAVRDLETPMTWVFSGQSLPGQLGEASEVPLSGIVGLYVRNYLGRDSDPIIDTTGPDLRIIDLLQQFETRVARFRPQVVVVGGSLIEADRGIEGLARFERNLVRLIYACRNLGSDIVLQTPRFVPSPSPTEEIDGPVYVEAIRSIAAEQGIGLVDHWTAESAPPTDRIPDGTALLTRFVRDLDLPGAELPTRRVAAALQ